ncbi:MAG: hypothetical protein P8129_04740 [Anaerolineae bacterium]|jgi:hypothetical protein
MSTKRTVSLLVAIFALALTAGMSLAQAPAPQTMDASAQGASLQASVGSGFTYQGRLTDGDGRPISDACDLDFTLWDAESGGTLIGHQVVFDVPVDDGYLAVLLNEGGELGTDAFTGGARWLKIGVRCSADGGWHVLPGQQLLSAVPYALSLRPGAMISGTVVGRSGLIVANGEGGGGGVVGYSHDWTGVYGRSINNVGLQGISDNYIGIYGESEFNTAGFFTSTQGYGVGANTKSDDPDVAALEAVNWGTGPGVVGYSNDSIGVSGNSTNGHGVHGVSVNEVAVYGESENTAGFFTSLEGDGVHGESVWGPGGSFSSTNGPGILIEGAGTEGLYIRDTVTLDYIWAGSDVDAKFKVSNIGDVFADGSYHCAGGPGAEPGTCVIQNTPADFAEMLPAQRGLEAGDVLVIGPDGRLARSSRAYQPTVVGVYSTRPGYLGSGEHQGQEGYAPLAVVGVVPVKVSTENGPIRPGDLLVASATPGQAMVAGPNPPQGTVIGKALAGLDEGSGVILMLAMLQ